MRAGILPALALTCAALLAGCATVYNLPGNVPLGEALADNNFGREVPNLDDECCWRCRLRRRYPRGGLLVRGPDRTGARPRRVQQDQIALDRVDFISGVSGGSVTAAYFGLKKRAALDDFRERFLLRNAEEGLNTSVNRSAISARASVVASTTASLPTGWM